MKFRREYKLNWTYRRPHSQYCYSECKWFDTELERNQFTLELFSQNKNNEIILLWIEENDLKIWENNA